MIKIVVNSNYYRPKYINYISISTSIKNKKKEFIIIKNNNYFEINHENFHNKKILFNFLYENFNYKLINNLTVVIKNIDTLSYLNQLKLITFLNYKNITKILTCKNVCFIIDKIKNISIIEKYKLKKNIIKNIFFKSKIKLIFKMINNEIDIILLRTILYSLFVEQYDLHMIFKLIYKKYFNKKILKLTAEYDRMFKDGKELIILETYILELNQHLSQSKSYLQH